MSNAYHKIKNQWLYFVIPEHITINLRTFNWNPDTLPVPKDIRLGDLEFYKIQKIGSLTEVDVFWELFYHEIIEFENNYSVLSNTRYGWITSKRYTPRTYNRTTVFHLKWDQAQKSPE